jgi:hypothetical protein
LECSSDDGFFAGSIRQKVVDRKSIFHIPNPKEVIRNDLAQALKRFADAKKTPPGRRAHSSINLHLWLGATGDPPQD